ncbi:hypothetical protein [Kordiimonas sp. SCSIO 12610]|uniref:hypothetical protein n=1 Tax=Kordiimonas sp. SCSIO 12610 TaxID=2829597 RepID=UPI00210AB553|nr:hypothetical protein [Kordiimonas sp. SCSIO 12610]UTW56448.1 hypothetical protein KFF44_05970 [Kordiimonas sp. SCSIO 12610]
MADKFVIDALSIGDIPSRHPVAVFAEKWPTFPKANGAALWENFTPLTCASVLPWASVIERAERDGKTIHRMKLQGSEVEKMAGKNAQGTALEDVLATEALSERLREFNELIANPGYMLSHTVIPFEGREFINVYRGIFAFTSTNDAVDKIVMITGAESTEI